MSTCLTVATTLLHRFTTSCRRGTANGTYLTPILEALTLQEEAVEGRELVLLFAAAKGFELMIQTNLCSAAEELIRG